MIKNKKGLLIILALLMSFTLAYAYEPGTEFVACKYGGRYVTAPIFGCPAHIDFNSNSLDLEAWYAGKCALQSGTSNLCTNNIDTQSDSTTDSSGLICAEDISDTPTVLGTVGALAYCKCGTHIYAISDTGTCVNGVYENPELDIVCNNPTQICGKWKYNILQADGYVVATNKIFNDTANLFDWPRGGDHGRGDVLRGTYSAEVWMYVPLSMDDVYIQGEVDDYVGVTIYYYNSSHDKLKQELFFSGDHSCGSDCAAAGTRFYSFSLGNLPVGWYNITYIYQDLGGDDQFYGQLRRLNGDVALKDIFTIANPYPISLDGDYVADPGLCDGDVNVIYGNRRMGFLNKTAWDPADNLQRHCCGDEADDFGFITRAGLQCKETGWVDLATDETCQGGGHITSNVKDALGLNYESSALDGRDACCGDDACTFNPNYCAAITNPASCSFDKLCKVTITGCVFRDYIDTQTLCKDSAGDSLQIDACRTKPFCKVGADNGYVVDGKYLCYYNELDFKRTEAPTWKWLDAKNTDDMLTIKTTSPTLTFDSVATDWISNGDQFYYCKANDESLPGIAVAEYETFKSRVSSQMYCSEWMSLFKGMPFSKCGNDLIQCCTDDGQETIETLDENCICYGALNTPIGFEDEAGTDLNTVDSFIQKDICKNDIDKCLSGVDPYDSSKSCDDQKYDGLDSCTATQICVNGTIVETKEGGVLGDYGCCFGYNANCVERTTVDIDTIQKCQDAGGTPFDRTKEKCNIKSTVNIDSTYDCCLGAVSPITIFSFAQSISNSSFMCFSQNNDSVFSSCCIDNKCPNLFSTTANTYISLSDTRVTTTGGVQNTLISNDQYVASENQIIDLVRTKTVSRDNPAEFTSDALINNSINNLSTFEYLEFDVLFTSANFNVSIKSAGNPNLLIRQRLDRYLINGNAINKWHHAVIPLQDFSAEGAFEGLYIFNTEGIAKKVALDNIIVTAYKNSDTNSQNRYCTGGFFGWIEDLDAPHGTSESDYSEYGPYYLACEAQLAYGWTGTQCCGDDTKTNNYGEYYNGTSAGCFKGTFMPDDISVAHAMGENENSLDSSQYRDVLYYNHTFLACQSPKGKYDALKTSFDGVNKQGSLISKNITDSCTVKGSYYCFDNAWRQSVPGVFEQLPSGDYAEINTALMNKQVPGGAELIVNGGFGDGIGETNHEMGGDQQ